VPEDRFDQHLAGAADRRSGADHRRACLLSPSTSPRRELASPELNARLIEPIDDYAEGPGWRLFGGDLLETGLSLLPDGCIDAIVTDPPYNAEQLVTVGLIWRSTQRRLYEAAKASLVALTGQVIAAPGDRTGGRAPILRVGLLASPCQASKHPDLGRHVFQTWKPWRHVIERGLALPGPSVGTRTSTPASVAGEVLSGGSKTARQPPTSSNPSPRSAT